MRAAHRLALALVVLAGCQFTLDRDLGPGEVRGVVGSELVGATFKPIEKARVTIDNTPIAVRSDAEGRFVLRKVPAGKWDIRFKHERIPTAAGVVFRGVELKAEDGIDLGRITIEALGAVSGEVRRNGEPVRVEVLVPGFAPIATGADGTFSLPEVPAGEYKLTVRVPGADGDAYFDGGSFVVKPRQVTTSVKIDLGGEPLGPGLVTVRVRLAGAADNSGVLLDFVGPGANATLGPSAANGELEGSLAPGVYTVVVRKAGFQTLRIENVVVSGTTNLSDILLVPDTCTPGTTDPTCPPVDADDPDADTIATPIDNCPALANADQKDTNADGIGDACEPKRQDLVPPAAPLWERPIVHANTRTAALVGTAEAGATVRLYAAESCAGASAQTTSADTAGKFAFAVIAAAADSETKFSARAEDAAALLSPCSATVTFVEDETKPAKPQILGSTPASPSRTLDPAISGMADPDTTVRLYLGVACTGTPAKSVVALGTGAWTATVEVPENEDAALHAQAIDLAGNASDCAGPFAYVNDRTPPVLTGLDFAIEGLVDGFHGSPVRATFEWTGAPADTASVRVAIASDAACTSHVGGPLSATASPALLDGLTLPDATELFACLYVADGAGNETLAAPVAFRTDFTAPDAPASPALNGAALGWTAVTDDGSGLGGYEVAYCSPAGACALPGAPQITGITGESAAITGVTACTSYDVAVRAVDRAGNAGAYSATVAFTPTLAPPANVRVTPGLGTAEVRWDALAGATGYRVCAGPATDACAGTSVALGAQISARLTGLSNATTITVAGTTGSCVGVAVSSAYQSLGFDTATLAAAGSTGFGSAIAALDRKIGGGRAVFAVGAPEQGGKGRVTLHTFNAYGAAPTRELVSLDGTTPDDAFGQAIASLGDLDHDGWNDFAVGAPGFDPSTGLTNAGAVYLYSGRTLGLLKRLDGVDPGAGFGTTVADAGDVNKDGTPDLMVGAPRASDSGAGLTDYGTVDVLDGAQALLGVFLDLSRDGANQPAPLAGLASNYRLGSAIASAGDVNGDGTPDYLVAASGAHYSGVRANAGAVDLVSGADSQTLFGEEQGLANDRLGTAVAALGDVNGDGKPDYAAGAPGAGSSKGEVRVFTWDAAATGGPRVRTRLLFALTGALPGDELGTTVAAAGDLDLDGTPDLLVGAPGADDGGRSDTGAVFAVSGASGKVLWRLAGKDAGDRLSVMAALGPVREDQLPGFAAAAPAAPVSGSSNAGYVLLATPGTTSPTLAGFAVDAGLPEAAQPGATVNVSVPTLNSATPVLTLRGDAAGSQVTGTTYRAGTKAGVFDLLRVRTAPGRASVDRLVEVRSGRSTPLASSVNERSVARCDVDGDGKDEFLVAFVLEGAGGEVVAYDPADFATIVHREVSSLPSFGTSVACLGDLDGKPGAEFAVGAPVATHAGTVGAGVISIFGTQGTFPAIGGASTQERLGATLAAGDVNGDGKPDLLAGAPDLAGGKGQVRAMTATGVILWTYDGEANSRTGVSVAYASAASTGSVAAVAIGSEAPNGTVSGAGSVVVIRALDKTPFDAAYPLRGADANDRLGASVAFADVNGDGKVELVTGAPGASTRGEISARTLAGGTPIWTLAAPPDLTSLGAGIGGVAELDGGSDKELLASAVNASGASVSVAISSTSGRIRFTRTLGANGTARRPALTTLPDIDGDSKEEIGSANADVGGANGGRVNVFGSRPSAAPASAPFGLSATIGTTDVTLTWKHRLALSGLTFEVEQRGAGEDWAAAESVSGAGTLAVTGALNAGKALAFRVRVTDARGGSAWSPEAWLDVPAAAP